MSPELYPDSPGLQKMTVPRSSNFNPSVAAFVPKHYVAARSTLVSRHKQHGSGLLNLPTDLLAMIFAFLDAHSLLRLAATAHMVRDFVLLHTMPDRLRTLLPRHLYKNFSGLQRGTYKTVSEEFDQLPALLQLMRLEIVEANQTNRHFSIVEEASWGLKAMPVIKADRDKMVIACGNELWVSCHGSAWIVKQVGQYGIGDISDIALTEVYDELITSFVDGRIERLKLATSSQRQVKHKVKSVLSDLGDTVEAIDYLTEKAVLLSVYQQGRLRINDASTKLGARPWCTTFLDQGRRVATGTRSTTPLVIHTVSPTGIDLQRTYAMQSRNKSSVFATVDLAQDTVLSGWYDGSTRLHDLRSPNEQSMITWHEVWDDAAVYSLAVSGNTIYAGSALNGVVRVFDLRMVKSSMSIYLGLKSERGPVYSIVAEHERVFGALESSVRGIDYFHVNPRQSPKQDFIGQGYGGYCIDHATSRLLYSLRE